ncbi:MAG: type II 3-dehydroquinate dehydratase [Oscillospiraceae bacterium]
MQAVLRAQGAEVVVISRRGPVTYDMIEQHADAQLVVNATPVGMYPENGISPLDLRRVPQCRCVLDLVYNPARTALLQQAERLGLRAENGLSMLAEQARCAAELFLQRPIDPARTAVITDALQKRMRDLILIGMPGAGKTTVGRLLAQRLGRDFFDADEELERRFGCDIPTFFAREGEAAFRAEETALLAELGKRSGCVIATGGGCVTRPENEPLLRRERRRHLAAARARPAARRRAAREPVHDAGGALRAARRGLCPLFRRHGRQQRHAGRDRPANSGGMDMNILVLNGPNLNLLGLREPELYGREDYAALERFIRAAAQEAGAAVTIRQSNYEGELVTWVQQAHGVFDGLVINAAAYTHTSVALLDALKAVRLPAAEVHLTDIDAREPFRRISYVGMACGAHFKGLGFEGYRRAIRWLCGL